MKRDKPRERVTAMDAQSGGAWQRLGKLLAARRARIDSRYRVRKVFAEEVALHPQMLSDLENASRTNFKDDTLAAIEKAYRWAPGSIERVLAGGEPTEIAEVSGTVAMALPALASAEAQPAVAETKSADEAPTGEAAVLASFERLLALSKEVDAGRLAEQNRLLAEQNRLLEERNRLLAEQRQGEEEERRRRGA